MPNKSKANNVLVKDKTISDKDDSGPADDKAVLALDPGRDKCGVAVMSYYLRLYHKNIIETTAIKSYLANLFNSYNIKKIVIGNGTFSREIIGEVKVISKLPIETADEAYTTVEAEERYRRENSGLWYKLFPFIRVKPSVPVDDYVALILAERFIKKYKLGYNTR